MKNQTIPSSEITPKNVYLSRRQFIKAAGVIAGSLTLAACGITPNSEITSIMPTASMPSTPQVEGQDVPNSFDEITNYNNYYEFTTDKTGVASLAKNFKTSPWEVEVFGLVNNPGKFDVDQLVQKFQPEERISTALCRGLEHGHPLGGFPAGKIIGRG